MGKVRGGDRGTSAHTRALRAGPFRIAVANDKAIAGKAKPGHCNILALTSRGEIGSQFSVALPGPPPLGRWA